MSEYFSNLIESDMMQEMTVFNGKIQGTLVITKCLGPVNSFVISDIRYKW